MNFYCWIDQEEEEEKERFQSDLINLTSNDEQKVQLE